MRKLDLVKARLDVVTVTGVNGFSAAKGAPFLWRLRSARQLRQRSHASLLGLQAYLSLLACRNHCSTPEPRD
jgi:hypothetical protein